MLSNIGLAVVSGGIGFIIGMAFLKFAIPIIKDKISEKK